MSVSLPLAVRPETVQPFDTYIVTSSPHPANRLGILVAFAVLNDDRSSLGSFPQPLNMLLMSTIFAMFWSPKLTACSVEPRSTPSSKQLVNIWDMVVTFDRSKPFALMSILRSFLQP